MGRDKVEYQPSSAEESRSKKRRLRRTPSKFTSNGSSDEWDEQTIRWINKMYHATVKKGLKSAKRWNRKGRK
jgi:hypothetical protein